MTAAGGARAVFGRWVARLLAAILVLAAAATAAHLALRHRLEIAVEPGTVARGFERWAEARLARDVEIGDARLRVLPSPGVELRGVRVAHRPGTRDRYLGAARSVLLEADLPALVLGELVVERVSVRGATLNPTVEPGGGELRVRLAPGGAPPVPLRIREIEITDGALAYRDRRGRVRLRAGDLGLEARGGRQAGGWRLDLRLRAGAVRGRPPAPFPRAGPVEVEGRLAVRSSGDTLRLDPSPVRVGAARLSLRGLAPPDGPFRLVAILERLLLRSLPTLPGGVRAEGVAGGELTVTGRPDGTPVAVSGRYRLGGLALDLAGGRLLRDGDGGGRILGDTLFLDSLETDVLGGPARIEGRIEVAPGLPYRLLFSGDPHVSALVDLVGHGGLEGAGRLGAAVRASGTLRPSPVPSQLNGGLSPAEVRLSHPGLPRPLSLPEGRIELEGPELRVRELPVLFGRQAFALTGTGTRLLDLFRRPDPVVLLPGARPRFRGSLTGGTLDLSVLEPGLPSRPPPSPVQVDLTLRLDTVRAGPVSAAPASARLRMGPEILGVGPARLRLWGGTVRPDLTLGLDDGPSTAFSLRLRMDSIRTGWAVSDLLRIRGDPPLDGTVTGRAEASGEVSAGLSPVGEMLAGSTTLDLTGGRARSTAISRAVAAATGLEALAAPAITAAHARLRFSGTGVSLDSLRLVTDSLGVGTRGSIGFDGTHRLEVTLAVPFARLGADADVWDGRSAETVLGAEPEPGEIVRLRLDVVSDGERSRVELLEARLGEEDSGTVPVSRPPNR